MNKQDEEKALEISTKIASGKEFDCTSLELYQAAMQMASWKEKQMIEVLGNLLFNKEEKIYRAYLDYDAFFEDLRKAMED